jgi:hypothetical protein
MLLTYVTLITAIICVTGQLTLAAGDTNMVIICYTCTSAVPSCTNTYFLGTGTPTQGNCACCRKSVNGDNVERLCANSLDNCTESTSNYICTSDRCNTAPFTRCRYYQLIAVTLLVFIVMSLPGAS